MKKQDWILQRLEQIIEPELAQLLLRLIPQGQQDQYQLIKGTIPVNLRAMLNTIKTIEKWAFKFPGNPRNW